MYVVTYNQNVKLKYIYIYENLERALCYNVCNRSLCYVFNQVEMADKEKYLRYCLMQVHTVYLEPFRFLEEKSLSFTPNHI